MQRDRQADRWIGSQSKRKEVNETETIKMTREKKNEARMQRAERGGKRQEQGIKLESTREGGGGGRSINSNKNTIPDTTPRNAKAGHLPTCEEQTARPKNESR